MNFGLIFHQLLKVVFCPEHDDMSPNCFANASQVRWHMRSRKRGRRSARSRAKGGKGGAYGIKCESGVAVSKVFYPHSPEQPLKSRI